MVKADIRELILATVEFFMETGDLAGIDPAKISMNRAFRGDDGRPVLRVHVDGETYTVDVTGPHS